ncbi:MAG: ATP-binding protein [Proteobacteria bacterium]|nr:ATP-binding protein [Pseudomonadota bacterium]
MKSQNGSSNPGAEIKRFSVDAGENRSEARQAVTETARSLGFSDVAVEELSIVSNELLSNFVNHGCTKPELWVARLERDGALGIEIAAVDRGPGIRNLEDALADRVSTVGTMGCGLGAIRRMMHEFDIVSLCDDETAEECGVVPKGTIITTSKWLNGRPPSSGRFPFSGYTRPCPGETENGDAFLIEESQDTILIAMLDGLGHGAEAHEASDLGIGIIRQCSSEPLRAIMQKLHTGIRRTRGCAAALFRLDTKAANIEFAGIGNIRSKMFPRSDISLYSRAGVVGRGCLPTVHVEKSVWPEGSTMVMHSDGIAGWSHPETMSRVGGHQPATGCHFLLKNFGYDHDDATVCVIKDAVDAG